MRNLLLIVLLFALPCVVFGQAQRVRPKSQTVQKKSSRTKSNKTVVTGADSKKTVGQIVATEKPVPLPYGCDEFIKDETNNTNRTVNDEQAKPAGSEVAKYKMCGICKLLCYHGTPTNSTHSLTFGNSGLLTSEMPAVIRTGDTFSVQIESKKIDPTTTSVGSLFKQTTDYWTNQSELNPVISKLKFDAAADITKMVNGQLGQYQTRIKTTSPYSLKFDKNKPINLEWDEIKQGYSIKTTVPSPSKNSKDTTVFSLIKKNPDNQFIKDVFDNKKKDYKGWGAYKQKFNDLYLGYSGIASKIQQLTLQRELLLDKKNTCACGTFDDKICDINIQINELLYSIQEAQKQLCIITDAVITDNRCWMRSWLWYTGGKPLLNPFGRISPAEENRQIEQNLAANEALLQLYQDLSKECCSPDIKSALEALKGPVEKAAKEIARLKKLKEGSKAREDSYANWLKNTAQTEELLNKSFLFVSNKETIKWMAHYNANDNFARMNPATSLPERVYEYDQVRGIVHNLTPNQKVSAKEFVKAIPLRTEFDLQTDALADALDKALSNTSPINALLDRLRKIPPSPENMAEVVSLSENADSCALKEDCLKTFYEVAPLIEWLGTQTEAPIADMEKEYNGFRPGALTPAYHSQDVLVGESQDAAGTNQINYELWEAGKDKPVAKGGYQTYATVKWWPFVSINYVYGSRAVSIFDPATGQFQTNTDIDNFEAIAGAKWYLKASNITRTHARNKFIRDNLDQSYNRARGNTFLSKTFLFVGLGVSHNFLKNYGLGVGYDIVPGFSIQGGANVFFRKSYEFDNGQIKYEYDIPKVRGFVGIAIDPNVVTKLIRLF